MILERGPIVQLVCIFHKSMTRLEELGRLPDELMDNFLWGVDAEDDKGSHTPSSNDCFRTSGPPGGVLAERRPLAVGW
jgi:hypothetical protein